MLQVLLKFGKKIHAGLPVFTHGNDMFTERISDSQWVFPAVNLTYLGGFPAMFVPPVSEEDLGPVERRTPEIFDPVKGHLLGG